MARWESLLCSSHAVFKACFCENIVATVNTEGVACLSKSRRARGLVWPVAVLWAKGAMPNAQVTQFYRLRRRGAAGSISVDKFELTFTIIILNIWLKTEVVGVVW